MRRRPPRSTRTDTLCPSTPLCRSPALPRSNPAVEWDRLAAVFADLVVNKAFAGGQTAGGSKLATPMEKFRHSPEGRTGTVSEKLRPMISASLSGSLDRATTTAARPQICVDYLNAKPVDAARKILV